MYPSWAKQNNRRQSGDRSSRQWDDYDDRREERREPRDKPRDSYHMYSGNGHSSTERTNKSKGYSSSPHRRYSKDSGSRKSSVRGSTSGPSPDKKRQRFAEDDQDSYRYRHEPEDRKYSKSTESFKHKHVPKEHADVDSKYRKTSSDSRHRQEEYPHRQKSDDHKSSGYYTDRDRHERSWDQSEERTRSQEVPTTICGQPNKSSYSPTKVQDGHLHNVQRFPLDGSQEPSGKTDIGNQSSRGFQRFLNVLNKGVNVDRLTKIVTQGEPEVKDRPCSPVSFNTTKRHRSLSPAERQQADYQNNHHWSVSQESQSRASPQPQHGSVTPKRRSPPEDETPQRTDEGQLFEVGNVTVTPEDELKHKQMQDVLQAIGIDLGSDELGRMSNRIQERLYGKKDTDRGRPQGGSRERYQTRVMSPRRRSRSSSSSSRSNLSSLTQDSNVRKDSSSGSAQREETEVHQIQVHQSVRYDHSLRGSSVQDMEHYETNSQGSVAVSPTFPPITTYSQPSLPPPMSNYSPMNYSPLPYPSLPPPISPSLPPPIPPSLPPPIPSSRPPPILPSLPPPIPPSLPPARPPPILPSLPPPQPPPLPSLLSLARHPSLPPALPHPLLPGLPPALPPSLLSALLPNLPLSLPPVGPRLFLPPFHPYPPPIRPLNIFPPAMTQMNHGLPQLMNNNPSTVFNLTNINPHQPLYTAKKKVQTRCLQVIETKQPG